MGKISLIDKLASIYFDRSIIKKASIIDNMAARILWSTIPYDQQINHIPALYSLYHGAKEYLKYGAMAIIDELKYIKQLNRSTDVAFSAYQSNVTEFFKLATELFYTPELWTAMYGGRLWGDISKKLYEMSIELELADKTRGTQEFIQHMNNVIVYMNVIDGMMHNSNDVLEKLIDQEFKGKYEGLSKQIEYKDKIKNLMDVKELKNSDDVMNYAANIVKDIPERFLPFKDWISKRRYESSFEPQQQTAEEKERELELIKFRKSNISDLKFMKENIDKIGDFAFNQYEKWRYLADIMTLFKTIYERLRKAGLTNNINPIIKKIDDILYRHPEWLEDEQFCENFSNELSKIYFKLRDV